MSVRKQASYQGFTKSKISVPDMARNLIAHRTKRQWWFKWNIRMDYMARWSYRRWWGVQIRQWSPYRPTKASKAEANTKCLTGCSV